MQIPLVATATTAPGRSDSQLASEGFTSTSARRIEQEVTAFMAMFLKMKTLKKNKMNYVNKMYKIFLHLKIRCSNLEMKREDIDIIKN